MTEINASCRIVSTMCAGGSLLNFTNSSSSDFVNLNRIVIISQPSLNFCFISTGSAFLLFKYHAVL